MGRIRRKKDLCGSIKLVEILFKTIDKYFFPCLINNLAQRTIIFTLYHIFNVC